MKRIIFVMLVSYTFITLSFSKMYFTPRDDIRIHLIELIKDERKSIEAALYMLTDKKLLNL